MNKSEFEFVCTLIWIHFGVSEPVPTREWFLHSNEIYLLKNPNINKSLSQTFTFGIHLQN